MSRLTYRDVMDLPPDHPKSIQFMKELKEMDAAYDEAGDLGTVYDDEESEDYFNRFIAGDR